MKLEEKYYERDEEFKWPKPILQALSDERAARMQESVKNLASSPCLGCALLRDLRQDYLNFFKICPASGTWILDKKEKCDMREERK